MTASLEQELELLRQGAAAIAVLSRPSRNNALSEDMVGALTAWYPGLARDPGVYAAVIRSGIDGVMSSGSDVRELLAGPEPDVAAARRQLGKELMLCWTHECFSKPTVSLIDGPVAGMGVGMTIYGTHRVAGDSYRLSMMEPVTGCFPAYGLSHVLARMPASIGIYLGLTGDEIGPGDACALGLATHHIPGDVFSEIEAELADAEPVDPSLDGRHVEVEPGPVFGSRGRIERYFGAATVSDILHRLATPDPGDGEWADTTLASLGKRSPLALATTLRAILEAQRLDLRQTLVRDFRLLWRLVDMPDVWEGNGAPSSGETIAAQWTHEDLETVSPSRLDELFAPLEANELALPTRAEMQALRS